MDMPTQTLIPRIAQAILRAKPEEQRQFLAQLPHLLNLSTADIALLKIAEQSFTFWNNLDDIVYDDL